MKQLNLKTDNRSIISNRREFLLTLSCGALAGAAQLLPLPGLAAASPAIALEHKVNQYVQRLRQLGIVARDEKTAWSVYDFTLGKKLVSINEDVPYQSASMIKPFIAQAYFYRHRENSRRYPYNSQIQQLMEEMIRISSNRATNELITRISRKPAAEKPKDVERLLKRHARGIFKQTSIVEYIPRNGRTYRNKASAHDYSRFLYALWNHRLPYSQELMKYMGLANVDRIKDKTPLPLQTGLYDKTGSTARLCGNMGIVAALGQDHKTYPYTFIGIIEKSRRAKPYGRWIRSRSEVIRQLSGLVYTEMRQLHQLV